MKFDKTFRTIKGFLGLPLFVFIYLGTQFIAIYPILKTVSRSSYTKPQSHQDLSSASIHIELVPLDVIIIEGSSDNDNSTL
jgi:hypothetical protein